MKRLIVGTCAALVTASGLWAQAPGPPGSRGVRVEVSFPSILYPDFYGGVWSYRLDSVTFTDVEGINVYKDDDAFYRVFPLRGRQGALLAGARVLDA